MKLIIIFTLIIPGAVFASGGGYGKSGGSKNYGETYQKPVKRTYKINGTFQRKVDRLKEDDINKYNRLMELKKTDPSKFIEEVEEL